jgi:hypothetical protein
MIYPDLAELYELGDEERDDQGRATRPRTLLARVSCRIVPLTMRQRLRPFGELSDITHEGMFPSLTDVRQGLEVDVLACRADPASVGRTFVVRAAMRPNALVIVAELVGSA